MEIVLVDVTIRREWMDLKVGDVIKNEEITSVRNKCVGA